MSLTVADVLAGFRSRWEATTEIADAVPGGLHEGLVLGSPPAGAYAVFECSLKEHARFSLAVSIQTYTLAVKVWVAKSATAAGTALSPVLDAFDDSSAWAVTAAGQTVRAMDCRPVAQGLAGDAKRSEGERVLVASRSWDVMLEVRPSG